MHENRKLAETEYFYGRMGDEEPNYDALVFNFSAFLSAARSAMQYARDEAISKPGGQRWYDSHMSSKLILQFFKDIRDVNIHMQPLQPSKSVTIHISAALAFAGSVSIKKYDAQGNLVEGTASHSDKQSTQAHREQPNIEHRYTLQEWSGPEDLFTLSRTYLDEVSLVIAEGISKGFVTG